MAQKIITDFVKSVDEHVYPQYDVFFKQFERVDTFMLLVYRSQSWH